MNRARIRFAMTGAAALLLAGLAAPSPADDEDAEERAAKLADEKKRHDLEAVAKERFAAADANRDGVLRGEEVPKGWADRFDRDGDGSVSRQEFVEVNSRPEKLRLLHPMRDARARAADMLRSFDQNKDGVVQREEYPGGDGVFRGADRNRNGSLEPPEVRDLAEEEIADIRKQMRKPGRYEFLVLFDVDKDGKVGSDEYDGPSGTFRKYDADGDGTVTYYELYPERMRAMKAGDERAPRPEKVTVIQSHDKDEDGKLSREEFPGNDTAWRRLDSNGDGWITAADGR